MKVKSLKLSRFQGRQNACVCILVGFSFMLLTFLTVRLFAPEIKTNATTQTASQTVGPNTISMSSSDAVKINVVPTSTPTVYSEKNTLSITNSCDAGATVTMTTNSTTSNKLTRAAVNSDTLTKDFNPATSTALLNGEWGYKVGSSATDWNAVPVKGSANPAIVYDSTKATSDTESVDVYFGVRADNTIPSGSYTNDVVYSVLVKPACLEYSLTWDMNGGTAKSGVTYPSSLSYGSTIDLSQYTPTREGYTFTGWSDGSSVYTGVSDVNASELKQVKLTAVWSNPASIFDITYMQEMTSAICNNTTTPNASATDLIWSYSTDKAKVPRTTLIDKRDNNKYLVSKLADGNCWMSQNLALELSISKALTSSDTDLVTKTSWTPSYNTMTVEGSDTWYYLEDNSRSYKGSTGIYYAWNATTAGSGFVSTLNKTIEDSICPKNWRTPTGDKGEKSFYKLITTYQTLISSNGINGTPLNFSGYTGYLSQDGTIKPGSNFGHYRSATATGNEQYTQDLEWNSVYSVRWDDVGTKGIGFLMRCVAR